MKIVLDTNVLISGLLQPYGVPGHIVRMVAGGVVELCYDARILSEYREVLLRPKFHFDANDVEALLEQIRARGYSISAKPLNLDFSDKDDLMFLEVAIAAGVHYLITGNLRDFTAYKSKQPRIISPADFIRMMPA